MAPPDHIATALRNQAEGIHCLEAAAELVIAQAWLHRTGFTSRFLITAQGLADGRPMARVDWSAVTTALDAEVLRFSGGERRMLRLTASLADGIPVDLRESLVGIDRSNLDLLLTTLRHASGQRPTVGG